MERATEEVEAALPTFHGIALGHAFASELPELAIPWRAAPAPLPEIVALNDALAAELGLDPERLGSAEGAQFLVGRSLAEGSEPVAQLYAGHQFGAYSPVLGDGRALLLGEIRVPEMQASEDPADSAVAIGPRTVDLHLKGSGRTPPARGDGFAALGPMLREYLVGEAMHGLGIPSSRALAVVTTGRTVRREDFVRDDMLPGAVLARVAASHLRVGSFQLARATGDLGLLERLSRFAIRRHYPELEGCAQPAFELFRAVLRAQARLTAQWMLVGFVHGVMNTDNVTVSGETLDYGPCAFIDAYDTAAVFSSIDQGGRYAYGAQPAIAKWNLARFAEALLPLLDREASDGDVDVDGEGDSAQDRAVALAEAALAEFDLCFDEAWLAGMAAKLGLPTAGEVGGTRVRELAEELLGILAAGRIDYTGAFRRLTDAAIGFRASGGGANGGAIAPVRAVRALLGGTSSEAADRAGAWVERWLAAGPDPAPMAHANPVTIPRNQLLADALEAATDGDLTPFRELLAAVSRPFEERLEWARFAEPAAPGAGRFVSYCGT